MSRHQAAIAALLGPAEAEVDCDTCFALLDQYVDEVTAGADPHATHPEMHAHLRGCPACREEFDSLHALVSQSTEEPS